MRKGRRMFGINNNKIIIEFKVYYQNYVLAIKEIITD